MSDYRKAPFALTEQQAAWVETTRSAMTTEEKDRKSVV